MFSFDVDGVPLGSWPIGRLSDRPSDIAIDDQDTMYIADATGSIRAYAREYRDANQQAPPPEADAAKVIVLLSDGRSHERSRLVAAIDAVRREDITVFTIGLGDNADEANLKQIATESAYYDFSPTGGELRSTYVQIARRIEAAPQFKSAIVTDFVPDNMTYVRGSGDPVQPSVSPDRKTLTWQLQDVLEPGLALTYRLRPEEVGTWPTNSTAYMEYVDGLGSSGRLVFPIPEVAVYYSHHVYLPFAERHKCILSTQPVNVVLALDTSGSMADPVSPGGRTKFEAVRNAVRQFLRHMDLTSDRAAIVSFNAAARTAVPLTGDWAALEARLAAG